MVAAMPAPLSLSKATITRSTHPDDPLTAVSLLVRTGTATVRRGRDVVTTARIERVESTGIRSWLLTLDDGSTWTVMREKGKCCGG